MSRYFAVWVTCCIFSLLVEAIWAEEGEGRRLTPLPSILNLPSDCLMDCTMRTYVKKQLLHHKPSIEFKDSIQGDQGDFCWSSYIKCIVGEEFDRAFVVLPGKTASDEQVEVFTSPGAIPLTVHPSLPLISESCGLLYEVTPHFSAENPHSSLCIQLRAQPEDLTCPPYLLLLWQSSSIQEQQSGG